jgi:hypothetical protein
MVCESSLRVGLFRAPGIQQCGMDVWTIDWMHGMSVVTPRALHHDLSPMKVSRVPLEIDTPK